MSRDTLNRLKHTYKHTNSPSDYVHYIRQKSRYREVNSGFPTGPLQYNNGKTLIQISVRDRRGSSVGQVVYLDFTDDTHNLSIVLTPKKSPFYHKLNSLLKTFISSPMNVRSIGRRITQMDLNGLGFSISDSKIWKIVETPSTFSILGLDAEILYKKDTDTLMYGPSQAISILGDDYIDFLPNVSEVRIVKSPSDASLSFLSQNKTIVEKMRLSEINKLIIMLEKSKVEAYPSDAPTSLEDFPIPAEPEILDDYEDSTNDDGVNEEVDHEIFRFHRRLATKHKIRKIANALRKISSALSTNKNVWLAEFDLDNEKQAIIVLIDMTSEGDTKNSLELTIDKRGMTVEEHDRRILPLLRIGTKWHTSKDMTFEDGVQDIKKYIAKNLTADDRPDVSFKVKPRLLERAIKIKPIHINGSRVQYKFGTDSFEARFGNNYLFKGVYGWSIHLTKTPEQIKELLERIEKMKSDLMKMDHIEFAKFLRKERLYYAVKDLGTGAFYSRGPNGIREPWEDLVTQVRKSPSEAKDTFRPQMKTSPTSNPGEDLATRDLNPKKNIYDALTVSPPQIPAI